MKVTLTALSLLLLLVLVGCSKPEEAPAAEPAAASSVAPGTPAAGGTSPMMSEADQRKMKSGN